MVKNLLLICLFAVTASARDLSSGDMTLDIGGTLKVPLYKDLGNLNDSQLTAPLSQRDGAKKCEGGAAGAYFSLKTSGNCATISYSNYDGSSLQPDVQYCKGMTIKADAGRAFKLVEVMDRCLIHPTLRTDKMYANLFYTSPLLRLQDASGMIWVTELHAIQKLLEINQTHIVEGSGECPKEGLLNAQAKAEKCAVDLAKKFVGEMCTTLGGKIKIETLKQTEAPWMCYTEMFNEKFCASYQASCKF
jgi:hypothetical protein